MRTTKYDKIPDALPTQTDIDWIAVEQDALSKRFNMKKLAEKHGLGVSQPTFKSWMQDHFAGKYRIDPGRQGRGNYIRLIPHSEQNSLSDKMRALKAQYGDTAFNRAFAEVTLGED